MTIALFIAVNTGFIYGQEAPAASPEPSKSDEAHSSFKASLDTLITQSDANKTFTALIGRLQSITENMINDWKSISAIIEDLGTTLKASSNPAEQQEILQTLRTTARQFDEFKDALPKILPLVEQMTTPSASTEPMPAAPTASEQPLTPTETPAPTPDQLIETPLTPPEAAPTPQEEAPIQEPSEPAEQTPSEPDLETEESVPPTVPPSEEPVETQTLPEMNTREEETRTIDENITDLPGGAPTIAQIIKRGTIEDAAEIDLKKLLQQKDKDFEEKFPGPEFLELLNDLNILYAYAKATRDYVNLAKQAEAKNDADTVDRLQDKIEKIKQQYINKIEQIDDRYRTTEWYGFYTKK